MEVLTLDRILTELDHVRLTNMIRRAVTEAGADHATHDLEHVLDAAVVVEARELPADIVSMYSQVLLSDMRTGRQRKLTLCYPHDAVWRKRARTNVDRRA